MTDLLSPPRHAAARDFTRPRTHLTFTIDDDVFEAASVLPGDVYAEFVMNSIGTDNATYQQQYDRMKEALRLALLPASFERFTERLRDKTNPIDETQLSEVLLWLMEAYGMRPTEPSQPSSDGPSSPESGMSSTGEQQQQGSIPATFLPTGS